MKKFKLTVSKMLLFTMIFSMIPFFTLSSQAAVQNKLELHAFYPAQMSLSDQTKKYIDSLNSISFSWGRLYEDLSQGVNTTLGESGNTMFYYPDDYIEVLKYAKSKGKSIQLSIFSDSVNAGKILPFNEQREKAVDAIVDLIKSDVGNGEKIYFDGVVIDFEGLQDKNPNGKQETVNGQTMSGWYNQFLKELKGKLAAINKKMFVAVNPLLNYTGYDYKVISEVADKMIVMAHDYEPVTKLTKAQVLDYTGYNSPNPIDSLAPIKKIQLAMEDVKKYVSKANLNKVMLQISFDAAQWRFQIEKGSTWSKTKKQNTSLEARNTPTYQMINSRIQNKDGIGKGITYGYNNELQSPFIEYLNSADNTQNIILYENSKSVKAKIDMVKKYGLGGISLWSLANVPDYTDARAKTYGLDVWSSILSSLAVDASSVKETVVTFKDKAVETAVRKQTGKTTGSIYKSDLDRIYRLAVTSGVKTLVDIKQLTNLEYLDLSNNKISDISSLSSLKNLRVLYLQRNSISSVTALKGLTKLEILSLNGNKISSISALSSLKELTELYLRENKITDFSPVASLKKLNILYLKDNKSSNYTKLAAIKKSLLECDF